MTHDKFSVEAGQVNGDAGSPAGAGTDFAAVSASGGALDGALAQFSRLVEALGVARDELAEQSLTLWRSSQADRESAALWHGRFDLAPCAYVVTDAEGIVCAANAAATDLLGTPRPFLLGKPLA
ncbi:MAG TPA: PAS domain-containing protein, partial [Dehalococcoidia bacterium]